MSCFYFYTGQYDSVIKANTFLEKYVLNKLHDEVAAQLHNDRLYAESQVAAAGESAAGKKFLSNFRLNHCILRNTILCTS